MSSKKVALLLVLLAAALAAAVGATGMLRRPRRDRDAIRVSGNIEVTDTDVSFKIAGRVAVRPVDEGQLVNRGALVARLDTSDLEVDVAIRQAEQRAYEASLAELLAGSRPEEIASARAAAEKARASLAELLAGSRPQEIAEAEAQLASARADEADKKADYQRYEQLVSRGSVTAAEFDARKSDYAVAAAEVRRSEEHLKLVKEGPRREQIDQARAALAQAEAQSALVRNGPRRETIDAARARVEQAKASLAQAETQLGNATLLAPMTGVVLSKNIEPGEFVAPGTPVVTVGDLANVWLRAYVNETDLGRVKVGQPARVSTDTYPGKVYRGHVAFLASQAEFTPKNVQTDKERVKLVYRVKIEIPNPHMELKPGMPADADILVGTSR